MDFLLVVYVFPLCAMLNLDEQRNHQNQPKKFTGNSPEHRNEK
jgi:hypothetical protein